MTIPNKLSSMRYLKQIISYIPKRIEPHVPICPLSICSRRYFVAQITTLPTDNHHNSSATRIDDEALADPELASNHPAEDQDVTEKETTTNTLYDSYSLHPDRLRSPTFKTTSMRKSGTIATIEDLRNAFRERYHAEAMEIYRDLCHRNVYLTYFDHATILTNLFEVTDPVRSENQALEIIQEIRKNGWPLDHRIYHTLFGITLKSESPLLFHRWIHEMVQVDKLRPDIRTLNLWMQYHAQRNDFNNVIQTWDYCVSHFPECKTLNTEAHAILVEAYARNGQLEEALELYDTFTSRFHNNIRRIPFILHEARLRAFGVCGAYKEAMVHFHMLMEKNVKDLHVFDAALEACQVQNNINDAYNVVWKYLNQYCDQANRSISLSKTKAVESAFSLPLQILLNQTKASYDRRKFAPLPVSFQRLIEMEYKQENYERVLDLYKEHVEKARPTLKTFEMVLIMSLSHGDVTHARDVIKLVRTVNISMPVDWIELIKPFGYHYSDLMSPLPFSSAT